MKTTTDFLAEINKMRSNCIVLNDIVYYVCYDMNSNVLYSGTATNTGIIREYEIEVDLDRTLEFNLEGLLVIMQEDPDNWESEEEND